MFILPRISLLGVVALNPVSGVDAHMKGFLMLNIFIGYDARETAAFHVLSHSLLRLATGPISITPLVREHFPYFTRKRGPMESTDFSISRFLVPYLSGYQGYSLFMDCDMLAQVPINDLWQHIATGKPYKAVWVCPHDYIPNSSLKMDNQVQTAYARKNWSSFMFFDNSECRILTPDYVNTATGLQLHRFEWLQDDQIGYLPLEWNWLVGEYAANYDKAKVLHYTLGGPWFPQHRYGPYADVWLTEYRRMTGQDFAPVQAWQMPPLTGTPTTVKET